MRALCRVARPRWPSEPASRTFDRWVGFVPAAAVLGITLWAVLAPDSIIVHLARANPSARLVHTVREAAIIALGFAFVAGVVVLLRGRLSRTIWFSATGVFVAIDLGLLVLTSQLATSPSNTVLGGPLR